MMPPSRCVSSVAKITQKRIISIGVVTITLVNLKSWARYGGAVGRKTQKQEDVRIRSIKIYTKKRRQCRKSRAYLCNHISANANAAKAMAITRLLAQRTQTSDQINSSMPTMKMKESLRIS